MNDGRFKEALFFFQNAKNADPGVDEFWVSLVKVYLKLERLEKAESILKEAKKNGFHGIKFNNIAKELESERQKFKLKNPSENLLQPIIIKYEDQKYLNVISDCDILICEYPKSTILYNIRGASQFRLNMLDDAIDSYKQAIYFAHLTTKLIITLA